MTSAGCMSIGSKVEGQQPPAPKDPPRGDGKGLLRARARPTSLGTYYEESHVLTRQRPRLESRCARVAFATSWEHAGTCQERITTSVYVDAAIWAGYPPDGVLMTYMCNIALRQPTRAASARRSETVPVCVGGEHQTGWSAF